MIAVYLLIKDFEVIYIGASRNVMSRIASHRKKDYDHYVIKQVYRMIRAESNYDHFAGFRLKRKFYIY